MANMKLNKHMWISKWDASMPNKAHFIHDEYHISKESELFHTNNAWAYTGHGRGFGIGINKKIMKVSRHGCTVDDRDVGKSTDS